MAKKKEQERIREENKKLKEVAEVIEKELQIGREMARNGKKKLECPFCHKTFIPGRKIVAPVKRCPYCNSTNIGDNSVPSHDTHSHSGSRPWRGNWQRCNNCDETWLN